MKRLLVTSDDFGMCHAVNEGIRLAMTTGVVRSSNLMAPCAWVFEAARFAREHRLEVGVHLCATSEWDNCRARPLTAGKSLRGPDGTLPSTHAQLAQTVDYGELEIEYRAQISMVESLGIATTHLDTHMIGGNDGSEHSLRIQDIVAQLARERGIPYTYERKDRSSPARRHFAGELVMSSIPLEKTMDVLRSWTTPGTYHLISHAAVDQEELSALALTEPLRSWARSYRVKDFAFVTARETRDLLTSLGFTLIGIRDLSL